MEYKIGAIHPKHNGALAIIIRNALTEYQANKPGTVFFDETTDHLYELFSGSGGVYFVATHGEEVVGGAGLYPTKGLPYHTCELVKMYLVPVARGKGLGKKLMKHCLEAAATMGYANVYIETMPELTAAIPMYEQFGFNYLTGPLGDSGHNGCNIWMLKSLADNS